MTVHFKIARECRRLEIDMNAHPVNNNLYIRTLRGRNIIRHRQIDNQSSITQKPNIPPRPNSLQKQNGKVMTSDTSTHMSSNKDMAIGNTLNKNTYRYQPNPKT